MKIDNFIGDYFFLSNFAPSIIVVDGLEYPTVEHAYQAYKSNTDSIRNKIRLADTPASAKKLGRVIQIRDDWDDVKFGIMLDFVRLKFQIPELNKKLLDTGDRELIEGNTWGDRFWGVCGGVGDNNLGKILMKVRAENV